MSSSSPDPLSPEPEDDPRSESDSSSISSEDSMDSDIESESFTDVTPLHSISNSPLPTQQKLRDSIGGTDDDNTDDSSDEDSNGKEVATCFSKTSRRATVKRAPPSRQNTTTGVPIPNDVSSLSDAIQKLDIQTSVSISRTRRHREQERRIEAENEHLLKRILAQKSRVKVDMIGGTPSTGGHHVASSSINRHRQQKMIHAQNLAMHKRIEAARNGNNMSVGVATSNGSPRSAPIKTRAQASSQTTTPNLASHQTNDTR